MHSLSAGSTSSKVSVVAPSESQKQTASAEERVFGTGLFDTSRGTIGGEGNAKFSCGLLLCAFIVVISSGAIFFLVCNVYVQWRSMDLANKQKALAKMGYILLSIIASLMIFQGTVIAVSRLRSHSFRSRSPKGRSYQKLQSTEEDFEMDVL
ncbi:hypothetical protein HG535_0H02070 [Zygotorulaspora mrakii]|uniref:Transmembrane protein n=1 Tax=Zygotorulaspora mrakii TaxID=42260 RepID=A0A7H9B8W2_ZYGMR|nr:uncharacterized protein HG535_0H02070 [Zygotorulaspora mrakii]QLG74880.1 hypothetical protein HG535_0H02070 [Zygotorulaspora mrakii]